jgi:hypothetical protein
MTKSYRIRTTPGVDKNIRININQDFDFLEILSLKLRQDDVYTRFCADYGVIAGRVIVNGGYGVPNATVSVFVPLQSEDEDDVVISTLYPYKAVDDKNEDGYRYNLLPYRKEYDGHTPTGTFPDREDVLTRSEVLEVYEKYYKYTVKTNESGDFMIIGVPLGIQTVVLDLDLSNIGCFSLRPADLIRMGLAGPEQFNGDQFKSSTDLGSLPQIVNIKTDADVTSFWGEEDLCDVGITRVDFDLRDFGVEIKPHAVFMGSIFSSADEDFLKTNCKPKKETGSLCDMVTAPGTILAIRHTEDYDDEGRPILEQFSLPEGGKIIDDNGTWLTEVPMNLNYVTTNEFGEQVLSNDPNVGIPTKGRYRFRIQYQNENGLDNNILRADYLVPNVKEWGWVTTNPPAGSSAQLKSYAFSLDWNDYGDVTTPIGLQMINEAINCEDRFYEFNYNKVYTVANFIDRWKWGYNRYRHLGIKEITDRRCTTTTNRFPVNDGVKNFDFIFFLFNLFVTIFTPVFLALIPILHVMALTWPILKWVIAIAMPALLGYLAYEAGAASVLAWPAIGLSFVYGASALVLGAAAILFAAKVSPMLTQFKFKGLNLPMMSYPDCEACPCDVPDVETDEIQGGLFGGNGGNQENQIGDYTINSRNNGSYLADVNSNIFWGAVPNTTLCDFDSNGNQIEQGYPTYFCYMDPTDYTGNDTVKNQKYLADSYGIRYGIAGYPTSPQIGMPITVDFSSNNEYIPQIDITYAQSLNLANLRTRYFDTSAPNRITTRINNGNILQDNMLILLVDPGTVSQLTSGTLLTFRNPDNVPDNNITGLTNTNQFGSNAVTGSCFTAPQQVSVNYINQNGVTVATSIVVSGNTDGKEYLFKTGIEYYQVVTGMTALVADTIASGTKIQNTLNPSNQYDQSSLLRKYFLNKLQRIYYRDSDNVDRSELINPLTLIGDSWKNQEILFLVRGVDPYTDKQFIEYDLSLLFGNPTNTNKISGQFYLNVPIQPNTGTIADPWWSSYKTPESHNQSYATSTLYRQPFNFQVDNTQFSSVTTNSIRFYSSLDKSELSFIPLGSPAQDFQTYVNPNNISDNGISNQKLRFNTHQSIQYQGNVEGGSLLASEEPSNSPNQPNTISSLSSYNGRNYSPSYLAGGSLTLQVTGPNPKLVFRSDRLPSSDKVQIFGSGQNQISHFLHQNDNFAIYSYNDGGPSTNFVVQATDNTNNAQDFDTTGVTSSVLSTFDCAGMVPLDCYEVDPVTNSFTVQTPCAQNEDPTKVKAGCYQFIQKPYVVNIVNDFQNFSEWKARFRMMFGACRGIFAHVFQNNWVNGSLYMFAFKKQMTVNILGQPKKYKYCGTYESIYRPGQGPIFYTSGSTNSFFYRCTPYNGSNFVGQIPQQGTFVNPTIQPVDFDGVNDRNLMFPTTVMDLGPRDEFTTQICTNPQFQGYIVDTMLSTSYNDTSDLLQLFIVSRLLNTNFLGALLGLGDASIDKMFSRTDKRMDGDIVQLFSINSEYGVAGFSEDEYDGTGDIYLATTGPATLGVFFSSTTQDRIVVSPGITTFTPQLTNFYGYPKTQEVPFYQWSLDQQTVPTIFGSDTNDWDTGLQGAGFYSEKYQSLSFYQTPYSQYFNNLNTGRRGFIYNSTPAGQTDENMPAGQSETFLVGAPYHFYFGLNKGKSAINRYITKYILNQDV